MHYENDNKGMKAEKALLELRQSRAEIRGYYKGNSSFEMRLYWKNLLNNIDALEEKILNKYF